MRVWGVSHWTTREVYDLLSTTFIHVIYNYSVLIILVMYIISLVLIYLINVSLYL